MEIDLPDWADCLFDESLRYIALKGGRGSAKSRSVATALVTRSAAKPLRILCTREIQRSIKSSVKQLLDDEIERLKLEHLFISTDTHITGANGSQFLFSGLRTNIDSVKSIEGVDLCWVEEAQTVSANSLKVLIPTIRKEGSQLLFTWNPKYETDPVDVMFCGATTPPRSIVKHVNYDDNLWFPPVLMEEMEYDKAKDYDKFLHVWMGQYEKHSEARVFSNWRVEDFDTPAGSTFRFGSDWGFANDPTTLVRCFIKDNVLYVDYEAYKIGCEIVDTPKLFDSVPESRKWGITSDSSRPETISHMRNNGFNIHGAIKGKNSIEEGITFLKSFQIVVHPRCKHTITELSSYRYKQDPITEEILPILNDDHNHVIDALRYALEALRKANYKPFTALKVPSL